MVTRCVDRIPAISRRRACYFVARPYAALTRLDLAVPAHDAAPAQHRIYRPSAR
jgi:hypothetical protein